MKIITFLQNYKAVQKFIIGILHPYLYLIFFFFFDKFQLVFLSIHFYVQ